MKTLNLLGNMFGRVSLIAGGAGHLGFAMGEALAEAGACVVVLDLSQDKADSAAGKLTEKFGGEHFGISVDLGNKEQIEAVPEILEKTVRQLDVLVNCAALVGDSNLEGWAAPFDEQNVFTWEKALEINLTGAFYLIQRCKKLLEKSKAASIINISSMYGVSGQKMSLYEGMDYLTPAAYAASKGGLVQLTRYLATVLAPKIRVNCISPGGIERGQAEEFLQRYEKMTPLARMGCEEDFKGGVHYLASDLSKYVTGQNIIIDGGWSL